MAHIDSVEREWISFWLLWVIKKKINEKKNVREISTKENNRFTSDTRLLDNIKQFIVELEEMPVAGRMRPILAETFQQNRISYNTFIFSGNAFCLSSLLNAFDSFHFQPGVVLFFDL